MVSSGESGFVSCRMYRVTMILRQNFDEHTGCRRVRYSNLNCHPEGGTLRRFYCVVVWGLLGTLGIFFMPLTLAIAMRVTPPRA